MGGFYTSSLDRLLSVTLSLTTALPQGEKSQSIKYFKWLYKKKKIHVFEVDLVGKDQTDRAGG